MYDQWIDFSQLFVSNAHLIHLPWNKVFYSVINLVREIVELSLCGITDTTSESLTSRKRISRPLSCLRFKVIDILFRLIAQK